MDATLCSGDQKSAFYIYDGEEYVIFDIPRSFDKEHLNYSTIEKIKDGIFLNTKYVPRVKMFKRPKVVVFMNELPDMTKLSEDRYDIFEINNLKTNLLLDPKK